MHKGDLADMTAQDTNVIVVGSCNVDYTCFVTSPPNPGETINGENFCTNRGGKGANVCVMAARCGAKAAMAGKVGADAGGETYASELRKDGIDTSKLLVDPELATGTALIIVDAKGENQIVVCAGANGAYSEEDVRDCESLFERCTVMVCQLEIPYNSSLLAAQTAKKMGVFTLFNPSPMPKPQAAKDFIKHVDCLVVNEHEAAMLTERKDASINDMASELLTMGPAHVIITMGGEGQTYVRSNAGDEPVFTVLDSCPLDGEVVDTTGAGDAFLGALAAFLSKKLEGETDRTTVDMSDIVAKAGKAASLTVLGEGAQSSYPTSELLRQKDLLR